MSDNEFTVIKENEATSNENIIEEEKSNENNIRREINENTYRKYLNLNLKLNVKRHILKED